MIVEKYENKSLSEVEREVLKSGLKDILIELKNIQSERINDLIESKGDLNNLPEIEYKLQKEINDLIMQIGGLIDNGS